MFLTVRVVLTEDMCKHSYLRKINMEKYLYCCDVKMGNTAPFDCYGCFSVIVVNVNIGNTEFSSHFDFYDYFNWKYMLIRLLFNGKYVKHLYFVNVNMRNAGF